MASKIRVLVIDDSALTRQILVSALSSADDIEVIGTAPDPYVARDKIKELEPDVLTLDVEMPRMDGLTFLEKLMRGHPMPVVMVSTLTEKGSATTLRALELGAVDFVAKPTFDVRKNFALVAQEVVEKVRAARFAHVRAPFDLTSVRRLPQIAHGALPETTDKIIAVGASTGGTEALKVFLTAMPPDAPGIVITQHMPQLFTKQFAERLNTLCSIEVKEAETGDRVRTGRALIAPGNFHMKVERQGGYYRVAVVEGETVNGHRPSVDVMFDSLAEHAGKNCVGVIMTGMGNDGAKGLLNLKQKGSRTVAQDEATCVVFGMPRVAIQLGAADLVLPIDRMAEAALAFARGGAVKPTSTAPTK